MTSSRDRISAVKVETVTSSDLLKEARQRAGLSQAQLARRAGKPTSVIGRWERNEVKPSFETLLEMIRACGFDLRFVLASLDESQDAAIRSSLDLRPAQRLEQLEEAANFILAGRHAAA
jgi:transcriptional regulator with XRE-family HTH domain